ncbi:MAG: DUF502 domain-containing protein [Deltaproteobacteria bacterium]|nr:DUF502 domain-containing protein [Deltaproteobacteria bacterium]NND30052.1 DUF502 domain-containing protein [Myxococcales bacterium]MBT8466836.1 DUF502 domain-containing protein [Deltaproteobacteria bacterium]NNK07076.1 DUF502 domain-containing protein [Myxococcales bacterium]NNK42351.1 DUF502 domain-containing protein [Myxococcales bacterium]
MRTLTRSFAQGLLVLAPVAITVWVVVFTVTTLDRWLNMRIPGLGIVITAAGITLIGYLAGNVVGDKLISVLEAGMRRVPLVRILYNSLRDLFGAFVGSKRKFDQPVAVEINPHGLKVLGFLTNERFADPHLAGHVSVYLPESYNFAGNLVVVPRDRVHLLDADGAEFMAFIVSGGVTDMNAAKTVVDGQTV